MDTSEQTFGEKKVERHFDIELGKLKEKMLRMALLVEESIDLAAIALFERDPLRAKRVIESDQAINIYEIEIDEIAHELIARNQPAAGDLRLITMVLKITGDLERMADQAVNIAQCSLIINQEAQLKPYHDLPVMSQKVRAMVHDGINSFMEQNMEKAERILESDDEVDELNRQIADDVQEILKMKPECVRVGVSLIMVAHNFERIADHATNIAEDVIYLKKGIDVRHHIRERRET